MIWHIAITETRYYLARLGVESPEPFRSLRRPLPAPPTAELLGALERSAGHVRRTLPTLPRDLFREADGEQWTTTKVLRRLAWHERSELDVVRTLLTGARERLRAD